MQNRDSNIGQSSKNGTNPSKDVNMNGSFFLRGLVIFWVVELFLVIPIHFGVKWNYGEHVSFFWEVLETSLISLSGFLGIWWMVVRPLLAVARKEQTRFSEIVRTAADGFIIIDDQGIIEIFNAAAEQIFGYKAEEVLGENISLLMPPPFRDEHDRYLSDYKKTGIRRIVGIVRETIALRKDGTVFPCELKVSETYQGNKRSFTGIVRDITERKWLEDQVNHLYREQTALMSTIPDLVYILSQEGNLMWWNKRLEEVLGLSSEKLQRRACFDFFPAQEHPLITDTLLRGFREGKSEGEFSLLTPHGPVLHRFQNAVFVNEEGEVIGLCGVGTDISRLKQTEVALREAIDQAENANKAKSDFLATMSHEIRTPMNGIIGMTELALETKLSPEQREYLETVRSSADFLLALINDILDFSKIEAGKMELNRLKFDLRECIDQTLKTLEVRARQKGLDYQCVIAEHIPNMLIGDSHRLKQVLVNLVGNAIKFTEKGNVKFRVEKISRQGTKIDLCFSVQDTGIGIPKEKQDQIFEAFSQADNSISRQFGGTGLGLSICSRLVEMMGGKIWVESIPNKGSTFFFTVQMESVESSEESSSPVELEKRFGGRGILLVADPGEERNQLVQVLSHWKIQLHCCEQLSQAVDLFTLSQPSAPDFDWMLVDEKCLNDADVNWIGKIGKNPSGREVPKIFWQNNQNRLSSKQVPLAFQGLLRSPIDSTDLAQVLTSLLPDMQRDGADEGKFAAEVDSVASYTLRGLRILLAEDNAVNQKLAVRILEKREHRITVVEDGLEALEALKDGEFDLLLTDIQMPRLSGFELADTIRQNEQETGKHLPIIALTAHALQGDKELCMSHGIDGYVSKPIRAPILFSTMEEVFQTVKTSYADKSLNVKIDSTTSVPLIGDRAKQMETSTRISESPAQSPCLDRQKLWDLLEGDKELCAELIEMFLTRFPKLLEDLNQSIEEQDSHKLNRSAHALKGVLGNFCAERGVEIAHRMEKSGRDNDLSNAVQDFKLVEAEVHCVAEELTKIKGELSCPC